MDIKKITEIIQKELPSEIKESLIIEVLADDKTIIPTLLKLLENERRVADKISTEMNSELSRALITLDDPNFGKPKAYINRVWVIGEIKKFYLKWQNRIRCNFKVKDLP